MVLLKSAEFEDSKQKKEVFNLNDIAAEARALVEHARREKQRILDQAQRDAQNMLEQARQKGHQQGHQAGLEEGRRQGAEQALAEGRQQFNQQAQQVLQTLHRIVDEFDQHKQNLLFQAEQGTVVLAVALAEKILNRVVAHDPAVVADNLRAALELVNARTDVLVSVHPDDVQSLETLADDLARTLGANASVKFQPDETVSRGGCTLRTPHGEIDARLETQIQRLADELVMFPNHDEDNHA